MSITAPRVSAIITCFNQARFLPDAIESVLRQNYACTEVIVIDDGSTDDTPRTSSRYPGVLYLYQENRGLSAARNAGLRGSTGSYVVFLDADDVLEPGAISIGSAHLDTHPDWAFVSGGHRRVSTDLRQLGEECRWTVHSGHYKALLTGNYIGMHAAVMYRRAALVAVGAFNEHLRACEDYDIYLRIARIYPVGSHCEIVASYRQHDANMSGNTRLMISMALQVHRSQYLYIKNDAELITAWKAGARGWWEYFGGRIMKRFWAGLPWSLADSGQLRAVALVLWKYPWARKYLSAFRVHPRNVVLGLRRRMSRLRQHRPPEPVRFGSFRKPVPLGSANFNDSVAGRYCKQFLDAHSAEVRGNCLEIGPEFPFASIAALPDESRDCVVCILQPLTFDLDEAIDHLHRILKPMGVLLAVLPGVAMSSRADDEHDYWRFTELMARRLFEPHFPGAVEVMGRGNAITTLAALHRLPATSLKEDDFSFADPQQQLLVTVHVTKTNCLTRHGNATIIRILLPA